MGDTSFPTQPSPENAVHDIYIRATSARNKNPPLKYYAKVVGKFVVHRDRLDEVGDRIGRSRKDAEEQRQQRKVQMIDAPPADVLKTGKRKDGKKPAPTPTPQRPTPSSHNPSSSTPTPTLGNDFRSRLIQCLAASPRTTDECIKLLLGRNSNPDTRKEFLRLLAEVCDKTPLPLPFTDCDTLQVADPPSKKNTDALAPQGWILKTQYRAEARSRSTASEVGRVSVARDTTPTHAEGHASPMPAPEPKKPAMLRKESKKQKKADTPILAKNESSGSSTGSNVPLREVVGGSTKTAPPPAPAPIRRLPPGSGYKAKASSPGAPSPNPARIPLKRAHPTGTSERRGPSRLASSSRPSPSTAKLPPRPSPAPSTTKQVAEPPKIRRDDPPPKRKRLEEDPQTEILHNTRIPKKRRLDDESRVPSRDSKDRSMAYEDGELPESPVARKKPRLDDNSHLTPRDGHRERERERERPRDRDRDLERELKSLPPKPARAHELSPSPRKSEQRSTPSTLQSRDSSEKPTVVARATSKSLNGKFKRGSSIYTSSDDEAPLKKQTQPPQPKASVNVPPHHKKKRDPPPRPPLPSDPVGIRAVYRERYVPYIKTYGKVVAQRAKLEEALNGSVSSDMDLMDEDDVTKLANELKMYQRELETIEAAYKEAGGRGKLEPERMGRSSSSD